MDVHAQLDENALLHSNSTAIFFSFSLNLSLFYGMFFVGGCLCLDTMPLLTYMHLKHLPRDSVWIRNRKGELHPLFERFCIFSIASISIFLPLSPSDLVAMLPARLGQPVRELSRPPAVFACSAFTIAEMSNICSTISNDCATVLVELAHCAQVVSTVRQTLDPSSKFEGLAKSHCAQYMMSK